MLAMDVVDTLRHQEDLALNELAQDDRDDVLKARLRQIYESQGLTVTDRILDDGIKALKESRFTYQPTAPGFSRSMAGLWVRRGTVGISVAALLALSAGWIGWSGWEAGREQRRVEAVRVEMTETLPRQLDAAARATLAEARTDDARKRAEQLQADGSAALARSDKAAAAAAISGLEKLRGDLVQTYTLRIVNRANERTGVFRIPNINTGARNYYLIVEAVTPSGNVLSLPIRSEEDGKTKTVTKWAVRVPKETFDAVARDKQDDGIIQNNDLGIKPRGSLDIAYTMKVSGGAITEW